MKINVVMPQLGESVTEGEVLRWLKRAGEPVQRDEALVEVKTDKATVEIPAPASGTLSEILVQEGGKVAVGGGIATLESTSEAAALAVEGASTRPRRVEPPVTRPKAAPATPAKSAAAEEPAEKKPAEAGAPTEAASAVETVEKKLAGRPPEPAKRAPPKSAPTPAVAATQSVPKPSAPSKRLTAQSAPPRPATATPQKLMTPLARRVAAELGVDPSQLKGTGEGGRITREDVLRAAPETPEPSPREAAAPSEAPAPAEAAEPAEQAEPQTGPGRPAVKAAQKPSPRKAAAAPEEAPAPAEAAEPAEQAEPQTEPVQPTEKAAPETTHGKPAEAPAGSDDEVVALSPIRRRIAARLVQSSQTIPHVTTAVEADMTPLAELRKRRRASYEKAGIKLTYMPFIMLATVRALKEFPAVNASWGGDKLILHKRVHLGVAVSIEGGLVVPVIRNADSMSLRQLAQRMAEVAEHARAGKLAAGEIQGGTFTITNPGLFGTIFSTPIINPPEAAILAVCRIAETPAIWNGEIAARLMTRLCLSYDHRIIDGETAIKFLQHMRATLEAAKFEMG